MELSSVNTSKLQSVDQKLTKEKVDETVTPKHGGGGIHIPPKKTDSVTLSQEAITANNEAITAYHGGGGIHIPD